MPYGFVDALLAGICNVVLGLVLDRSMRRNAVSKSVNVRIVQL